MHKIQLIRDIRLQDAERNRPAFGAELHGDSLHLPPAVFDAARSRNLRTAAQLVSYADIFPEALPALLGWSEERVGNALAGLSLLLNDRPAPVGFSRGYGALRPF